MDNNDLKEYLKHILDLECAIYQTRQLKAQYQSKRKNSTPQVKSFGLPSLPVEPRYESGGMSFGLALDEVLGFNDWAAKLIGVCFAVSFFCLIFPIVFLIPFPNGWTQIQTTMIVIGIVTAVPVIYFAIKALNLMQEDKTSYVKRNQEKKEKYEAELDEYEKEYTRISNLNKHTKQRYDAELKEYEYETFCKVYDINKIEEKLNSTLTALYAKDIVYTKYRNLVSIATLFEYIDSGRCFELEGPNGAYNLYEGELRADMIISSLNSILSDLEAIKNNQYTLYRSIENANATTREMLININNSQMLTAYYAEQSAIAASADRYIVGMIW